MLRLKLKKAAKKNLSVPSTHGGKILHSEAATERQINLAGCASIKNKKSTKN